jgi:hypothetical protein
MAHEDLSEKINAMPHVTRLYVNWQIFIRYLLSCGCRSLVCPVPSTEAVLLYIRYERVMWALIARLTRQCSWWNTENVDRVGAMVGCTKKPPSAGKISRHARLVCSEGGYEKLLLYWNVCVSNATSMHVRIH